MVKRCMWVIVTAVALLPVAMSTPAVSAGPGSPIGHPAPPATAPISPAPSTMAHEATATVQVGRGWLNIRPTASTLHPPLGQVPHRARLRVRCQLDGEVISGPVGDDAGWLRLARGGYVSEAYVTWSPNRPRLAWCDQPADPAPATTAAFIAWAAERAEVSWRGYGVPVSVSLAQAINESGWGKSALSRLGNAYFGIKCFGTPGPLATGCRPFDTYECRLDDCAPTTGIFRVYPSAARSFRDHGRFLSVHPRYQPAFAFRADPDRFARELHRAGYATDPNYSDKLIALMRAYDLYRFDR